MSTARKGVELPFGESLCVIIAKPFRKQSNRPVEIHCSCHEELQLLKVITKGSHSTLFGEYPTIKNTMLSVVSVNYQFYKLIQLDTRLAFIRVIYLHSFNI